MNIPNLDSLRRISEADLQADFENQIDQVTALGEPLVIVREDGQELVMIPLTPEWHDFFNEYEWRFGKE